MNKKFTKVLVLAMTLALYFIDFRWLQQFRW